MFSQSASIPTRPVLRGVRVLNEHQPAHRAYHQLFRKGNLQWMPTNHRAWIEWIRQDMSGHSDLTYGARFYCIKVEREVAFG